MTHRGPAANLRLLTVFWFLRDAQIWIPVWVVFLTLEKGFSLTEVTAAEGLFLVGVVVLEVPTGAVADHWGRSRSLALGAATLAVAVVMFAYPVNFAMLLASFLLWSVASTLMSGADMALLFDTLKEMGRDHEYERLAGRGGAVSWGAVLFATVVGGVVAGFLDIRATILIGAGTCVVAAAAALLLCEPARSASAQRDSYQTGIRKAFGEAWHTADVRAAILLAGTAYAALEAVHYVVQPYLSNRGVEVGALFSLLQAPMWLAGLLGSLAAARIGSALGPVASLVALPVAGGCAFFALAAAPGLTAFAAFPLIFAFSASLEPIASGYVNRRISSERRATVLSIKNMVASLLMAGLAPAIGYATDARGLSWAFALAGLVAVAAVVCFGLPFAVRAAEMRGVSLAEEGV